MDGLAEDHALAGGLVTATEAARALVAMTTGTWHVVDAEGNRRVAPPPGRTITQASWDWITHIDDYMSGCIDADELERHIGSVLARYDRAGTEPPTILRVEDLDEWTWR